MNESVMAEQDLCETESARESFRRDCLAGLCRPDKSLPCKYFYDEEGARLFEAICELEEYYPTRTEVGILRRRIKEIASLLGPDCHLVELGSGSTMKTRLLLDHLDRPASYVPIDVARTQLLECSARLSREYAGVEVLPVCADYTNDFELPDLPAGTKRTVAFFPGSTIGNFEPHEARCFLQRIAGICGAEGGLLIGVDLKKDPSVLNPAYNDALGITAEFNLNVLARANRELEAGFDLAQFQHHAFYNELAGRVEMHLVSRRQQVVPVSGRKVFFAEAESIATEHCYKYSPEEFRQLAARAGWEMVRCWTDDKQWFGVHYLVPGGGTGPDAERGRARKSR
ncbi:MAG: Methyltransferase [Pedosphaera sp.]|nr:Methyltransferase [Pedosphaera sp.]